MACLGAYSSWRTGATSEKRLITTLLDNYNRNGIEGRPVIDTSRSLSVALSFSLIQIIEFDQQLQMMTVVGWIHLVVVISYTGPITPWALGKNHPVHPHPQPDRFH